jgi:hypothetical protein
MRRAEHVIANRVPFIWLGLVRGISVIETPIESIAPGITTALGLGIGRSRALSSSCSRSSGLNLLGDGSREG